MVAIPKSARLIGAIVFDNGNETALWAYVTKAGEPVLYQRHAGKASRCSGRNLQKVLDELETALNEGEAGWVERCNSTLDAFLERARCSKETL